MSVVAESIVPPAHAVPGFVVRAMTLRYMRHDVLHKAPQSNPGVEQTRTQSDVDRAQ